MNGFEEVRRRVLTERHEGWRLEEGTIEKANKRLKHLIDKAMQRAVSSRINSTRATKIVAVAQSRADKAFRSGERFHAGNATAYPKKHYSHLEKMFGVLSAPELVLFDAAYEAYLGWEGEVNEGVERHEGWRFESMDEAKQPTFLKAREALIAELKKRGWTYTYWGAQGKLKVPYATSRDGRLRLWFKSQAVLYTQTNGSSWDKHTFKDARSLHMDIRAMTPEEVVAHLSKHYEGVETDAESVEESSVGDPWQLKVLKGNKRLGVTIRSVYEVRSIEPFENGAKLSLSRLRGMTKDKLSIFVRYRKHLSNDEFSASDGYGTTSTKFQVIKRKPTTSTESVEESITDAEGKEAVATGRKTKLYRKGEVVSVLDDTGYHDAKVQVMSTMIYRDVDYDRYYLLVKSGGERQFERASKSGKMREAPRQRAEGAEEGMTMKGLHEGAKMKFGTSTFEVVLTYKTRLDATGPIGRDFLRTIPSGGGGAIVKKLSGGHQDGHYFVALGANGKPDGNPMWMSPAKLKRAMRYEEGVEEKPMKGVGGWYSVKGATGEMMYVVVLGKGGGGPDTFKVVYAGKRERAYVQELSVRDMHDFKKVSERDVPREALTKIKSYWAYKKYHKESMEEKPRNCFEAWRERTLDEVEEHQELAILKTFLRDGYKKGGYDEMALRAFRFESGQELKQIKNHRKKWLVGALKDLSRELHLTTKHAALLSMYIDDLRRGR